MSEDDKDIHAIASCTLASLTSNELGARRRKDDQVSKCTLTRRQRRIDLIITKKFFGRDRSFFFFEIWHSHIRCLAKPKTNSKDVL